MEERIEVRVMVVALMGAREDSEGIFELERSYSRPTLARTRDHALRCCLTDFLREVVGSGVGEAARVSNDAIAARIDVALKHYASGHPRHARRADFIRYRFGIDDGVRRTIDETGRHFGVSRSRAGDLVAEGLVSLRSATVRDILLPKDQS